MAKQNKKINKEVKRIILEEQKNSEDHIEEIMEYQENLFNPGHYVGTGKIPLHVKAPGNAFPLAIWMFIQAVGFVILYSFLVYFLFFSDVLITFSSGSLLSNFIGMTVVFLLLTLLCARLGFVYLKKAKSYRLQKKQLELKGTSNAKKGQIAKRGCPQCRKKHDIDFPKCPYCEYSYITK